MRGSPNPCYVIQATLLSCMLLLTLGCSDSSEEEKPPRPSQPASEPQTRDEDLRSGAVRFGVKDAPEKAPGNIRLATYNLENLVIAPAGDETDPKPEAEVRAIAETIRKLDADILAVQQVESLRTLELFRDEHLADMGYIHVATADTGDPRGIQQGVLSRFPIVSYQSWPEMELGGEHPEMFGERPNFYAGQPMRYRRSPLMAVVQVPAGDGAPASPDPGSPEQDSIELTLLVVHHKSHPLSGYWRDAEAAALAGLIREMLDEQPDRMIAVLGDFSAQIDAPSVKTYLEVGFRDAQQPELIETGEQTVPEKKWATHTTGTRIDMILVNEPLRRLVEPGSGFVLGTPARAPWEGRSDPKPEGWASDHYPVAVDLRVGEDG